MLTFCYEDAPKSRPSAIAAIVAVFIREVARRRYASLVVPDDVMAEKIAEKVAAILRGKASVRQTNERMGSDGW
jgi:hypothetical protein